MDGLKDCFLREQLPHGMNDFRLKAQFLGGGTQPSVSGRIIPQPRPQLVNSPEFIRLPRIAVSFYIVLYVAGVSFSFPLKMRVEHFPDEIAREPARNRAITAHPTHISAPFRTSMNDATE